MKEQKDEVERKEDKKGRMRKRKRRSGEKRIDTTPIPTNCYHRNQGEAKKQH